METTRPDLRFDFEAIIRLEEKGINILGDGLKEAELKKASTFMVLVWAGLLHSNPELTDAQARAWVKGMKPKDVIEQVTKALTESVGSDETAAKAAPASS